MSNAAGMVFLENFPEISAIVKDAYEFDCETRQEEVTKITEKAEKMAGELYELCKLLKTQRKWNEEMICAYKDHAFRVHSMWCENFNQKVFPKQHCVVWHVLEFVNRYGAFGIFSEESFESRHVIHKKELSNLKSMKNLQEKFNIYGRRIQANINAKYEDTYVRAKKAMTGKSRGNYKTAELKKIVVQTLQYEREEVHGVIYISDELAIEKEWAEVYYLIVEGKVPASWNYVFVKRVNIDESSSIYTNNT